MLAHEAHAGIDLDPSIRGTTNIRLEDVDAGQAIEVLAASENLSVQLTDGVYHLKTTAQTDDSHKGGIKQTDGLEAFGQAFANALSGLLDTLTKPEVAQKFAKYKHNYYLALIKEGFTADEALKIVIASGDPGIPGDQKGK